MTDLSTATVDELLDYRAGWKASEAGQPIDPYRSRHWLQGWNEFRLALLIGENSICGWQRQATGSRPACSGWERKQR